MNEISVADYQSIEKPVIHRREDDFFLHGTELAVRAAIEALACHSSVKRDPTPVYTAISAGDRVEHTADQSFFFIQKADELTTIKIRIKEKGTFFFSVAFREMEDSLHRPTGSGELLSSDF